MKHKRQFFFTAILFPFFISLFLPIFQEWMHEQFHTELFRGYGWHYGIVEFVASACFAVSLCWLFHLSATQDATWNKKISCSGFWIAVGIPVMVIVLAFLQINQYPLLCLHLRPLYPITSIIVYFYLWHFGV